MQNFDLSSDWVQNPSVFEHLLGFNIKDATQKASHLAAGSGVGR